MPDLSPRFTRNTTLQDDIRKHPSFAARIKAKLPDRFNKLAGPDYVEVVTPIGLPAGPATRGGK